MTNYDLDFHAWALEQAEAARRRSANEIDWDNVAEELASLGKSQEAELYNRYVVLLSHLLKWMVQPERRGNSWRGTIAEQRRAIARLIRQNPSLMAVDAAEFAEAYAAARDRASAETDLGIELFPLEAPFSVAEARREDWWPQG